MVKYQFGKNWSWCNEVKSASLISDKIIDTVYRLDAASCSIGACKTNCPGNPYCLNGLGEKKLINLINKEPSNPMTREDYLRSLADYAGLVNLGATCYINTYLQVWYNNIQFREYILGVKFEKIKVKSAESESDSSSPSSTAAAEFSGESMPVLKFESTECLGANLQMMFTLMKESVRKSIDPNFFIRAIGLDENMQQDAQEFSQLFLTTIQSSLNAYDESSKHNDIIQELFEGEYSYITECYHCKRQSVRHSNFVELSLNIQNCSTIKECLDDLLKEEIMDGENQYYCSNCDHKRNAKRMTKLARLPPVLNLQLLRFVYDRNSGYKKKLSTRIKFSEILDLSPYAQKGSAGDKATNGAAAGQAEQQPVYQLGAILMHVGKTAYSGHYMAQIKNFKSNEWYNFNDEVISKIKRKQQLGCTDEEIDSANSKQNAAAAAAEEKEASAKQDSGSDAAPAGGTTSSTKGGPNKTFSTANAYLLVYYRTDLMQKMSGYDEKSSESNQHDVVAEDNQRLESWFNVQRTNKMNQNDSKNCERAIVHSIFESLWSANSSENRLPETVSKRPVTDKATLKDPDWSESSSSAAAKRLTRNVSSSRDLTAKSSNGGSTSSSSIKAARSPVAPVDGAFKELDKQKLFFVTTEFLKKLISQQSNIYPSDAASINSIQKFMCPHKRLNPLAINRFKVVSKLGIDQIMECYNLKPADIGALEVYNEQSTLCRQCVVNCYEYLRFKEKLKQDSKLLRQLLKYDITSGGGGGDDNLKMESETESVQSCKPFADAPEASDTDVILIDMDENSVSTTASSNGSGSGHRQEVESSGAESTSHKEPPISPASRTLFSNINGVEKSVKSSAVSDSGHSCDSHSSSSNGAQARNINSSSNENKENSNGGGSAQVNGSSTSSTTRYYIGKESLKCWQSLALKRLEAQLPSVKFIEPASESLPNSQTAKGEEGAEQAGEAPEIVVYEESTTTAKEAEKKLQLDSLAPITPSTVTVFNEDITCPHNCLAPTPNKRLVNSTLWHQIFQHYFYSDDSSKFKTCPIFTEEAKECKLCLKTNEEISNKKIEIKNQKEILTDLYFNKLRPSLQNLEPYRPYYLIMAEFVKEWRAMIKQFKFKNIKILNQVLFCQHLCLPFDQDSIDDSLVTLLTEEEWNFLSENYEFDMEVTVTKLPKDQVAEQHHSNGAGGGHHDTESGDKPEEGGSASPKAAAAAAAAATAVASSKVQFDYVFKPHSCYLCLKQNELSKMQFENKKIFIRQIDEDNLTTTPIPSSLVKAALDSKDDSIDADQTASKRARLSDDAERETGSSSLAKPASSSNIRRSKRTRKCKGDMELYASSSTTIKSLKIQMAAKVSRMLSEQHLFFKNMELDNEKTLGDYCVLAGDILYLKIDQITNDEIDSSPFEFAHLPEIGFKGTNLLK